MRSGLKSDSEIRINVRNSDFISDEVYKMLTTPLGKIEILIDKKPISYFASERKTSSLCPDLAGRYTIEIKFIPDGKSHEIECLIKDYHVSSLDGIESGERLELKSFYFDSWKMSIGMEGDSGYLTDGTRIGSYDYDNEYVENGVKYVTFPDTETNVFVFGIAWIDNVNNKNDVQTWFGANPTIM